MKSFFIKIKNIFFGNSLPQRLFQGYLLTIIIGSLLLMFTFTKNHEASFIDSLFVAASAFSDTGLSTVVLSETFNFWGQLIILILIQVGGIGIMTIKIMVLMFLGRKIHLKERLFGANERGSGKLGGSVDLIKISMIVIFSTDLIAALALILHFNFKPEYASLFDSKADMVWTSIFHSVSSVNNAGFDVLPGGTSLAVFKQDYFVQIVTILCLFIGGIGFPVFYDLKCYIVAKRKKEKFRMSLFTKFSVKAYIIVGVIGIILVFISELLAPKNIGLLYNENYTLAERIFYVIFNTSSTRNAGYATIDLNEFQTSTQLIFSILMWIGACPSSTGGGIRCTTFMVVMLLIKSVATGKDDVETKDRSIPAKTVFRALSVFITGVILIVVFTLLLLVINMKTWNLMEVLFEVSSAFGTTGLTLGITPNLNVASKLVLIVVMFIGQVGISSFLLIWSDKKVIANTRSLPEEDITIG